MIWQNWALLALLVVTPLALLGLRTWIRAFVEKRVQHGFDKQIEGVRSEFRNSEESLKSALRSREAENAALRDAVLATRAQRHALLDKRRMEAVERLWGAMTDLAAHKQLSSFMSVINFDVAARRAPTEPKFRQVMATFAQAASAADLTTQTIARGEQPFVTPLAWAFFSAYQAIVFSALARAKVLELGIDAGADILDTATLKKLLKAALPESEAWIETSDPGAYHHLLDSLEIRLLAELKAMLENPDIDQRRGETDVAILDILAGARDLKAKEHARSATGSG